MDPRISVRTAYDSIGPEFGKKRTIPWDFVVRWLENKIDKSGNKLKLLVAGCGSGRHVRLAHNLGYDVKAVDISEKMVKSTKLEELKQGRDGSNIFQSDICSLNFENEEFDLIISIAVLHHLPFDLCELALNEFSRILKKQGEILVSCWDPSSPSVKNGTNDKKNEHVTWVSWTLPDKEIVSRYYHLPTLIDRKSKWELNKNLKIINYELEKYNQLFYFSKI
ncbi:MAG: hypothetical protein CMB56_004260 [Methanobacteriota archaeon]|nr:MAG: hypothetical protein CMB56_004260 [Euryarchaeota archaeon]|tara:strand:- start:12619 stop:13284 length:666 start_codon:yes stop_codon:yes gene_type:complete